MLTTLRYPTRPDGVPRNPLVISELARHLVALRHLDMSSVFINYVGCEYKSTNTEHFITKLLEIKRLKTLQLPTLEHDRPTSDYIRSVILSIKTNEEKSPLPDRQLYVSYKHSFPDERQLHKWNLDSQAWEASQPIDWHNLS